MTRRSREPLAAPEPVQAILDRAGESRFAPARAPIAARLWRDAVGARIADRVSPLSLYAGVLTLRVPSSVWAHELSLLTEELCVRLQERGIEARQLKFRVACAPKAERPPERRVPQAVPLRVNELPPEVACVLAVVADPELRTAIARAVESNLAWQSVSHAPPEVPINEAQRGVRAPRCAGAGTAPSDQRYSAAHEARRRTPAAERDRSR